MSILSPRTTPSKATAALVPCPTCNYGYCTLGSNCKSCLEVARRSDEARARARQREIAQRLQVATGIALGDLAAALLPEMATGIVEIVGAVNEEGFA